MQSNSLGVAQKIIIDLTVFLYPSQAISVDERINNLFLLLSSVKKIEKY